MLAALRGPRQADGMTAGGLVGLVLLSMAWLYALAGLALNGYAFLKRSPGPWVFLPAVAASLAVFFSVPVFARLGLELPWPWLWILLPLALDPYNPPLSWLINRRPPRS
jgi:hypothetical protein